MEKKISERTPDFAKNLKKYLGKSGMTMEQLAEKAGISLHTIKGFCTVEKMTRAFLLLFALL